MAEQKNAAERHLDFNVSGMSCAACSARVEKAVSAVVGVSSCAVSLLTHSMRVVGDASAEDVIRAVEKAGYGASVADGLQTVQPTAKERDEARESGTLLRRFCISLGFLLLLMYVSMGHGMFGFPLPALFADNPAMVGLLQLLLSAILLVINQRFFISGIKGLLRGAPNMDTLVSLGAGVSFLYSTYVLFAMLDALGRGDITMAHALQHAFYFESAGMILTLITLGKWLEARAKGKTTDAIRALLALSPETATVLRDGKEIVLPVSSVVLGDTVVLRPGERVPVDGTVIDGAGAFDESALTGESLPVDKGEGSPLYAATVNLSGALRFRVTGVGESTALARIVRMVKDASATKAPIAKIADRVSGVFVPAVLAVSLLTFAVWMFCGIGAATALDHAIAVLVISCPCALGLATPVAIMVGSGVGARMGILFKTAASLEETGRAKIVIFDKTGTVTEGKPSVTDVIPADGVAADEFLSAAYAAERGSEHPLGRAVVGYCEEKDIVPLAAEDFCSYAGNGVSVRTAKGGLRGGKVGFALEGEVPDALLDRAEALAEQGKTPLWFSLDGVFYGLIAVADAVKAESRAAVAELKRMGVRTVMLTGDHEKTAHAVAATVGIDEVIAGVLPEGKAEAVRRFKKEGNVIMVGDGINDAPALTEADIGIAIGAGTDIAVDAADVVLTRSDPCDVPHAIALSRAVLRNVRQNLFWAFFYNLIGIPLAAGVFVPLLGWSLSPMFGAAAMSLSSVTVVSNALRLRFFKPRMLAEKRQSVGTEQEEKKTMQVELKIEGMMCPHCSGRVKAVLEALDVVASAEVSHEKGNAVITLKEACDVSLLQKTVTDCGYKIVG